MLTTLSESWGFLTAPILLRPGLGILLLGDSQEPGRAPVNDLSPRRDPSFPDGTVQPTTYVRKSDRIAQAFADPPVNDVSDDGIAVQPYTGTGSVLMMGPNIAMGQVLTSLAIPAHITTYAVVGLKCALMLPAAAYPTTPPSWFNSMVTYQTGVESTYGVETQIIGISAGNNDGLTTLDSNNLSTNMVTLYNGLFARWPLAKYYWVKIHPSTDSFPGFISATRANQLTGFASLPNVTPIYIDDQTLLSDNAHLNGNGQRVYGSRMIWRGLRDLFYIDPRPAAIPQISGDGAATATDGPSAPTSDGSPINNDEEILLKFDMLFAAAFTTNATPGGWLSFGSSTFNTGSGVGCRMSLYKRLVDTAMLGANHGNTAATSVVLDTNVTRLFTKIIGLRGPNASSAPTIAQVAFGGVAGSTSSYTGPSLTTGGPNRLVLAITCGYIGANVTTTVALTGLTGGVAYRNGMLVTPGTAQCCIDVQYAQVPSIATINLTNVATSHSLTGPVTALVEIAP